MCSSCSALSITTRYCNTKTGHKRSICHGKGIILYMSEILSLETCTQAFVWQRTGQYVSIGYDHNAEPFHSGMTWCSIVADVRQCTFHMHKSRPTIMLDSFSHYKIATSKSVDLLHAVWIIVFPLTYRVGHKKLCSLDKPYFPQMLEFSQDFFVRGGIPL